MHLELHYKESTKHAVCAAFIRGTAPAAWLNEISRWGVLPGQLECYVMPQTISNIKAAGVFVVFKGGVVPDAESLPEPYGLLADKLYVPQQAVLVPEVEAGELKKLLLWDLQVYHPTIGLVGFDKADALDLGDLLSFTQPRQENWRKAHSGIPPKPPIKQVRIQQLSLEEVLENFKKSIEPKSLEEIPKKKQEESTPLSRAADHVKRGLLKGALGAYKGLKDIFSDDANGSASQARSGSSASSEGDAPGIFQRLEHWMLLNLQELERKRNAEINRLLNLFDEDSDEALRYAIPLDSPYLTRGSTKPGFSLTRRSTDFSLRGLGGGGVVDSWDIGNYYSDLRTKYQRTAQKEIEAQRYQKAAYVYAHLLGDFYSAAKTLEQGKHYREAAALYKDHLKNKASAAECLERGGLLMEAIDLYGELNKHEKVGDLYKQLGQKDTAASYFERCIEKGIANNDYLDASRIIAQKLEQPERARAMLLQGWKDVNQAEACLKRYFELTPVEKEALISDVQEVYTRHTPESMRSSFLNVLVHLNQQRKNAELLHASRNLAYEIISEQAQEGNNENIYSLKKFLQEDRLISSDCSRYVSSTQQRPVKGLRAKELQLDKSIKWAQVVNHRNQYLALGTKAGFLHLARGNWYGNFEYYSWPQSIEEKGSIGILAAPHYSRQVVLWSGVTLDLDIKTLPKNKYFDEALTVGSPAWISNALTSVGISDKGTITALKVQPASGSMDILQFDEQGALMNSVACVFKAEVEPLQSDQSNISSTMICRNGRHYLVYDNWLLQVEENGKLEISNISGYVYNIAVSDHLAEVKLAVCTDLGLVIMRPTEGELITDTDFFAPGEVPLFMKFITSDILVVADQQQAIVYSLSGTLPREVQRVSSISTIVGVLATAKRHQFALLEETGKINTYEINGA